MHGRAWHYLDGHRVSLVLAEEMALLYSAEYIHNVRVIRLDDVVVDDETIVVLDDGLITRSCRLFQSLVHSLRYVNDRLTVAAGRRA